MTVNHTINSHFVPQTGLEPVHPKIQDFKSCVSTSSTTRAEVERKTGLEPATPTLARSCSTS